MKLKKSVITESRDINAARQPAGELSWESEYRLLVENANEAILVACDGVLTFVNPKASLLSGYSREELISKPFADFIHPDDRQMVVERHLRRLKGEKFTSVYPFRIVAKDGNTIWVEINTVVISWKGKPATLNFLSDITERRLADARISSYQKKLRSLASKLFLAEESERRRIAMEVHDRVSQTLAICSMKLGALSKAGLSADLDKTVDEVNNLIKQLIDETHSLTFELISPLLYEFGPIAALEHLTQKMQKEYGVLFKLEDCGLPEPLDDDIRILLFQIVRELLVNIVKHAHARHASVCIKRTKKGLRIVVEDDGAGFNTCSTDSKMVKHKGFGLFAVRERLDYIGGHFKIESKKGFGTRATIIMPLKQQKERKSKAQVI